MPKNKVILFIVIAAAAGMIAGCGLFGPDEPALVVGGGYINGYVETQDGAPLTGVTVNYSIPDEPAAEGEEEEAEAAAFSTKGTQSVVTDAAGFFQINELIPGDYRLTFTISGYTIGTDVVRLTPEGFFIVTESDSDDGEEGDSQKYEYTDEIIVTLYAKIATASGAVFAQTATGTAPATGQVVVAKFQDRYFSSATVDANGRFSFTGLPAGQVAFYARSFYDGTVFFDNLWLTVTSVWDPDAAEGVGAYVDVPSEADLSDRDEALGEAYWEPGSGTTPYVTSGNISQNFPVTQSIELTFNKEIITSDFMLYATGPGGGGMMAFADGDPIDFAESWDATGTTVTLDPSVTLRSDYNYEVSYTVEADDYYTGSSTVSFRTERGIAKIGSNIEGLDEDQLTDFAVDSDIELYFNMDIARILGSEIVLTDITEADITDPDVDITIDITTDPTVLAIDPVDNLQEEHTYELVWTVYSALDNSTDSTGSSELGTIVFSTVAPALVAPTANPTGFTKTAPASIDHNTTGISLQWDRVSGVSGYQVLAYTAEVTNIGPPAVISTTPIVERTIIADISDPGTDDYSTTIATTVSLNDATFDAWPYPLDINGDGNITAAAGELLVDVNANNVYEPTLGELTAVIPFGNSTAVILAVRSYNSDGNDYAVSTDTLPTLELFDVTGPNLTAGQGDLPITTNVPAGTQPGPAGPYTATYLINEAIADSTFTVSNLTGGGGGSSLTTAGITAAAVDDQTVELTIQVPNGETLDGSVDYTIDINVIDTSGRSRDVTVIF